MNPKQMLTKVTALGLLACFAILGWTTAPPAAAAATETDAITRAERPAVEVMFVLDTTGSMGGLIAAAKDKIWSIANTLASADPTPQIKMGLVGYRDRADAYVTTFTPLSEDLDAVYTRLMQFEANGGGDTPESVNQALHEAVTKTHWNRSPSTYRVIFLVGDAPPHMNYSNDIKYNQSCQLAAKKNIIINTIQCGDMAETRPIWRQIAHLGEGRYFQVAQSGSAVLYDTPYDDEISKLSRELDNTRIYYGTAEQVREMEERKDEADKIYRLAKPSAVAKRTIFNAKKAGAKNFAGSRELVHSIESGDVALSAVPKDQLPSELQTMSETELKSHIKTVGQKRKALQTKIGDLAKQRQAFIAKKVKSQEGKGASSLDAKIYQCIQSQALKKGINYTQGPEY